MRSGTPGGCRQKVAEQSSHRIVNEYCNPETVPQYFQISVGVLEGRNFTWLNPRTANSYVVLMIGKKKSQTTIRKNTQEPQYKEYFAFGMYVSLYDLRRSRVHLAVMEPRCCAPPHLIGETCIDLGTVWTQLYFQAFCKWMQLSRHRDPTAGSMGFLKVDISIKGRGSLNRMPVSRSSIIKTNHLLSSGSEQQQANFIITIHGAFGLPYALRHPSDKKQLCPKPPKTFVRVLFCELQAKTAMQILTNNPMYHELVSMVEMFPSSNPIFRFEVCSSDVYATRLLGSTSLNLDHISHDGENGFLPTFGPSLLPLYGSSSVGYFTPNEDSPFYRGSLLISLNIAVPYYQQSLRSISVEPVVPISLETLWSLKNFCIFCPIFEVSMIDSRVVNDLCGVAITIGEIPNESTPDEGFAYIMDEVKSRKLYYTGSLDVLRNKTEVGHVDFSNTYPVLQATTQLPDYRFRIYRNNAIYKIVCILKSTHNEVDHRLKNIDYSTPKDLLEELNGALNNVAGKISQYLNSNSSDTCEDTKREHTTDLDAKQFVLQTEEMKRIREKILQKVTFNMTESVSQGYRLCNKYSDVTRRSVKCLLTEMDTIVQDLEKIIFKATEGLPDVVVWLLSDGSRVGFCKIPVSDIIFSNNPEECGINCGRIQTIYFKPLKCSRHVNSLSMGCFCNVGKVEVLAWLGLHEQSSAFEPCLPDGHKLKIKDFQMCIKCKGIVVECRVFIYKARLLCNNINGNLNHVYLRINVLNSEQNSKAIEKSSTLIWNQLLKFNKLIYSSTDRLFKYPPVVLIEVNSTNLTGKSELIGAFHMDSVVEEENVSSDPKLRWYEMYKGMENTGKVLMSVQILPVPETVFKSTAYSTFQEYFTLSDVKGFNNQCNIEQLPSDFIPRASSYKLDVYWWGLRNANITKKPCAVLEIEDVTIKSEFVHNKKNHCNFPNGRVSKVFEAAFNELFYPTMNVKLYDNRTFGRTIYMGTSVVKKPNNFFTFWYPKVEREATLKLASLMMPDFVKVSQTLFVKKNVSKTEGDDESSIDSTNAQMKRSFWRKLFCKNEPDEEEYVLLPTNTDKYTRKTLKKRQTMERKDWWSRYVYSQKSYDYCEAETINNGENFVIYDSELELQPEFSKFRDWCATFKVYNDEKIGIPDKDRKLQCGFLKAGIAIYKWPPPENTVAVSSDGVDLSRGFFNDYPSNDSAKFLVRVYLIKGFNLIVKNNSGKSYPFVIISCGSKQLGDRGRIIPNTCNPTFGTVYELRCTLPDDYQLTVSLYNHDLIEADELIGSTTIDLENRIYTKHRARIGLAQEYRLSEPEQWRDCTKPSVILEELCAKNHLPRPTYPSLTSVVVSGVEYKDNDHGKGYASTLECRENVCLSILHHWNNLPICGYPLVPEHVETRSLYHPDIPGIERGKIHMWVDIFPIDHSIYIPPPVDVAPRKTEEFELKLTIYKVKMFERDRVNELFKPADLYVRAWTGFLNQMQNSNCHSISSDGYYIFNQCMIFSFDYDYAERKLVKKEINQFTDFEENRNPKLKIELMDSDSLALLEPIGLLTLNLNEMPQGEKNAISATGDNLKAKMINLFSVNSVRAWWPLKRNENVAENVVGAIQLEITLIPKQKTTVMSVGLGNDLHFSSFLDPRTQRNRTQSNFDINNFFYKHNAMWGSFTGICVIILVVIVLIYFLITTYILGF